MERTTKAVLQWSVWRRWHQAWARYHHYRRRAGREGAQSIVHAELEPPDVIDVVWCRLEGLHPPAKRTGRPYTHDRRVVLEAIVYLMHRDYRWRDLPAEFPPWQTVYSQLCRWKEMGIWDKIWNDLPEPGTVKQLQL